MEKIGFFLCFFLGFLTIFMAIVLTIWTNSTIKSIDERTKKIIEEWNKKKND